MSFFYRTLSVCRVRRECGLSCRGCIHYKTKECEDLIDHMHQAADNENYYKDMFPKNPTYLHRCTECKFTYGIQGLRGVCPKCGTIYYRKGKQ